MLIAEVKGTFDGKDLTLTLDVTESPTSCSVDVKLVLDSDAATLSLQVAYLGDIPTLSMSALSLSGVGACLGGCGLTTVVAPVVQCAKTNKTVSKFAQCVKAKGLSIAATTIECILACLGGAAVGGHITP